MAADLAPGVVVRYPYLWRRQADQRETEGRKARPVCVIVAQVALKVPEIECRRAGLSDLEQSWITVSEYNYDIAERSFYLDPAEPALGRFGKPFLRKIAEAATPLFRGTDLRVDRTE